MALASLSCRLCQERKKKCSKQLPECALCVRLGRTCKYPQQRMEIGARMASNAHSRSDDELTSDISNGFPPSFFIDPIMFEKCRIPIPQSRFAVPSQVMSYLGDMDLVKSLVTEYFATMHQWMPVVSRIRLYGLLLNPLPQQEPDTILLLLSMKLILSIPEKVGNGSQMYSITKQFCSVTEAAGCFTLQMIQAGILIALYELGHGIYPAAFLTIATCARYGTALGIDNLTERDMMGADGEEKIRAWWGILIIDHILNLGTHGRHLSTRGPNSNDPLPMDDDDWDRVTTTYKEPQRLSAPTELKAGRFARTAQAINLLSQAFQYLNSIRDGTQLGYEHLAQLNRTILALSKLTDEEGQHRGIILCCPTAFCSKYELAKSK